MMYCRAILAEVNVSKCAEVSTMEVHQQACRMCFSAPKSAIKVEKETTLTLPSPLKGEGGSKPPRHKAPRPLATAEKKVETTEPAHGGNSIEVVHALLSKIDGPISPETGGEILLNLSLALLNQSVVLRTQAEAMEP